MARLARPSSAPGDHGRKNQRKRTERALVDAARQLLEEGKSPNLTEVADRALVSKATAYRYFPSVDALLATASLDEATLDVASLLKKNPDPRQAVREAARLLIGRYLEDERSLHVMMKGWMQVWLDSPGAPGDDRARTLPLDATLELCGVDPARTGPPDPATSVVVVNIGGERGDGCPDSHWVYEPEAAAGFHRYGVYSNVDRSFVPGGRADRVALYVEHARRRGDRPDPAAEAALVAAMVDELVARDVVRSVDVVDVSWVPTAYTWSVPGSTWVADALAVLDELGVEQVGRYARWHFQGIAESIAEGLAVGEAP